MAIVGPLGLVKTIRELKVSDITKQADRVPRIVLCGTPEERDRLHALLRAGSEDEMDCARLAKVLVEIDLPLEGDEVVRSLDAQALFTVAPANGALLRLKVPAFQVSDEASLGEAAARLAAQDDDWLVGLGRHVPGLRAAMAERLTAATAAANAEIALISALPGVAPITQILLPPAAVADIVLLTKNQIMLVLKLAAIFGKPLQVTQRLWELAPTVGSAFGWRQLAREVVGAVPGGVGVAAKASVAYAGTFTIGRAAQIYYTRGQRLTPAEERGIYADALARAKDLVADLRSRLRRKPRAEPEEEEESESHAAGG